MKIYLIFLFATLIIANEENNSAKIYANEWPNEQNWDNNEDSTYAKANASSTKRFNEINDAELRKLDQPYSTSVTLVVSGKKGERVTVLDYDFRPFPDFQYINGSLSDTNQTGYFTFPDDGNYIIKLEWNVKITNCMLMLWGCQSAISIDLSDFDSSEVTNMGSMFRNCEI